MAKKWVAGVITCITLLLVVVTILMGVMIGGYNPTKRAYNLIYNPTISENPSIPESTFECCMKTPEHTTKITNSSHILIGVMFQNPTMFTYFPRWWFHVFLFSPLLGEDSHFNYLIFFKRVGSTTNQFHF